jgi:alpha-ketoglutarate-dependent taurine dioxygenase
MNLVSGADVVVARGERGAPRLIDIERRLSSGGDLLDELATLERKNDELLVRFNADFATQSFVDAASCDSKFRLIESSDGQVSNVVHRADPSDRSARTDAFDFHNDGLYLADPPYYCALYCLDPGDGDIPTVLADSSTILSRLVDSGISLQTLLSLQQSYVDRRGVQHAYDIVRPHPTSGYAVLQYFDGEGELITSTSKSYPFVTSVDLEEIKAAIHRCIRECTWQSLRWERGHFVVWNNYAFLHARISTKIDLRRHLARFWIRRIGL